MWKSNIKRLDRDMDKCANVGETLANLKREKIFENGSTVVEVAVKTKKNSSQTRKTPTKRVAVHQTKPVALTPTFELRTLRIFVRELKTIVENDGSAQNTRNIKEVVDDIDHMCSGLQPQSTTQSNSR